MDNASPDGAAEASLPLSAAPADAQITGSPDRPIVDLSARMGALFEVILCSDYPTQILLGAAFALLGFRPAPDGSLDTTYVVVLSLTDTVLLVGLMVLIMRSHGESARRLFFNGRPIGPEVRHGVSLIFAALAIVVVVMLTIQLAAPFLHTVVHNPLQDLIKTPPQAALFAIVVVVAGGVREELQRAFLLRRFEQYLGGATVGVVVGSIAFGAGHLLQGVDATIATGVLGAFWAIVYLRRRSVVAPMVSHSGFNLVELAMFMVAARS